jgi:hypothetical protein
MVCQYSTRGLVSSGKRKTPSEAGVEERGSDTLGGVIAAEVMGGYCPRLKPSQVVSRVAKAARAWRSRTHAILYVYETLLERLAQHL